MNRFSRYSHRTSFSSTGLFAAFCGGFATLVFGLFPAVVGAQVKYTPEHPEVEALARKAVAFLTENPQADHGEAVLAAITAIEVSKRYDGEVPVDHPLVQLAVSYVLDDLSKYSKGESDRISVAGIYYACLATILLSETSRDRYQNEVQTLLTMLRNRKQPAGSYGYKDDTLGDSSQSQYVALALAVTTLHQFPLDLEQARDLLDWYTRVQRPEGHWVYHYLPSLAPSSSNSPGEPQSLAVAGAGTVYLLGDILGLNPVAKSNPAALKGQFREGLPPSVSLHIRPRDDKANVNKKDGPKIAFDGARLASSKRSANTWIQNNYRFDAPIWNFYTLYGFERYAYFREKAEGEVREFPTWYDSGVEYLMRTQVGDGSWYEGSQGENANNGTCFATLFLVRSSQVLMRDGGAGQIVGAQGFDLNTALKAKANGDMVTNAEVKTIDDVMDMLKNTSTEDDLDKISQALGPAIKQFTEKEGKSRGEQMAFLRGLVTDENFNKRLVAIRFLASQQDLDNVPALLYALTDPDFRICREAHNGLRLISRKVDAFTLTENASRAEYDAVRKSWTDWYLGIRPDAQLFEDDQ